MKWLWLLSAFLATGCGILDAPVGSNPFEQPPAQAMMPQAVVMAATQTAQPTASLTATASPTRIDYGPLPITETAVALEQASIGNERARLQARETGQALDQRDAEQTATWAAPSETAVARGTATAVAWVQATQAAKMTESASRDEEAARAVMLQQESVKAGWLPWLYGLVAAVIVLVGVLAAAWLRAGYAAKVAERRMYEQPVTPLQVDVRPVEQVSVKLDHRDGFGFGAVDYAKLPISRDDLMEVANLLAHGARYNQAQMTGAERPLVKDGSYDEFGGWMVEQGIAIRLDDGRYQIQHMEFFEQVVRR